jgi:hypothetical protein
VREERDVHVELPGCVCRNVALLVDELACRDRQVMARTASHHSLVQLSRPGWPFGG